MSAWLAKKDGTDFHYRKDILANYLKHIHDIKFFIKEKETLKWINEENENIICRFNSSIGEVVSKIVNGSIDFLFEIVKKIVS